MQRVDDLENKLTLFQPISGLYERHKFLFTLLLALKIDLNSTRITHNEFLLLLKGGAALDLNAVKPKPFRWMLDVIWLNLVELSKQEIFNQLLEKVTENEKEWKYWCDTEAPEEEEIPCGYKVKTINICPVWIFLASHQRLQTSTYGLHTSHFYLQSLRNLSDPCLSICVATYIDQFVSCL